MADGSVESDGSEDGPLEGSVESDGSEDGKIEGKVEGSEDGLTDIPWACNC